MHMCIPRSHMPTSVSMSMPCSCPCPYPACTCSCPYPCHMQHVTCYTPHAHVTCTSRHTVRDRFQFGKPGSLINLHGPVHWFQRHSYDAVSGDGSGASHSHGSTSTSLLLIATWSMISVLATAVGFSLFYVMILKPRLVSKYIKRD